MLKLIKKRPNLVGSLFLATVMAISFISCSKDNNENENNAEPEGTISLNMLDVNNGKTLLGNSDVYIDNAQNFYGYYCSISSIGKRNGLGSISEPVVNTLASKLAVETSNAFQLFKNSAIKEFPSGKLALNVKSDYYNAYVVSQIKHNDTVVGANVKYILMDVPSNGLPQYDSEIGEIDHLDQSKLSVSLTLPESDFEVELKYNTALYKLELKKQDKRVTITLINPYDIVDYNLNEIFGLYIRIKNSYTYVYGSVI